MLKFLYFCYRAYSLSGSYRHVIAIPERLSWKIVGYKNKRSPLVQTDLMRLKGEVVEEIEPNDGMVFLTLLMVFLFLFKNFFFFLKN